MKRMVDDQKSVTRQALSYVAEITRDEAESNIKLAYSTIDKSALGDKSNPGDKEDRGSLGRTGEIMHTQHDRNASAERIPPRIDEALSLERSNEENYSHAGF